MGLVLGWVAVNSKPLFGQSIELLELTETERQTYNETFYDKLFDKGAFIRKGKLEITANSSSECHFKLITSGKSVSASGEVSNSICLDFSQISEDKMLEIALINNKPVTVKLIPRSKYLVPAFLDAVTLTDFVVAALDPEANEQMHNFSISFVKKDFNTVDELFALLGNFSQSMMSEGRCGSVFIDMNGIKVAPVTIDEIFQIQFFVATNWQDNTDGMCLKSASQYIRSSLGWLNKSTSIISISTVSPF